MAKLADAADLKSADQKWLWGFKSPSRHHNPFKNGLIRFLESARSARLLLAIAFSCCALLFNPVLPIHLRRNDWRPLNIAASIAILACTAALGRVANRVGFGRR